ncbi:MAG: hypothetical protein KF760_15045 [Candidatus Eremiobacteraeota bacterium]|nr:hypothetical protein [Candidatus Eremiobacteraeota bacterium]MCW5866356.1 hypothetical protein [Candidatus Eremiobacteraeota bacterium]
MKTWLLAALLCIPAAAQEPAALLEARSVFGDIVRYGCPFQADVEVGVQGNLSQDCLLEVDGGRAELTSRTPIRLAPGKRSYQLPIVCAQYGQDVRLRGTTLANATTSMQPSVASDQDYMALTLVPRKNQFSYLGGYKSLLKQGEFRLNQPRKGAQLPDLWWTYLGHDAVVVYDLPALKLSDRVEAALIDYTQAGGNLVLVSNTDPQELHGSRLADLAPLRARAFDRSNGLLTGELAAGAETALVHHDLPLLLRRSYGSGTVWQVTAPIETQDVLGTRVTQAVWQKVLAQQGSVEVRKAFEEYSDRLSVLPELPAPATAALAWYLAGYVLIVVPGIYIYLRRKDQVLRLILVVPACSLLITFIAYFINSSGRGRELVLRELGTAWVRGGQKELVLRQQGVLFSPAALRFSLDFPADTLMRPRYRARDEQQHVLDCRGESLVLEPEKLRQWGLSRWGGLGLRRLSGPISFKAKEGVGMLRVTIDNRSDLPECKAVVITSAGACSPAFDVRQGRNQEQIDLKKMSDLRSQLKAQESEEDAGSLSQELQGRRLPGPALVMTVPDGRFAVMHCQGLNPKTIRHTYLIVSEDPP